VIAMSRVRKILCLAGDGIGPEIMAAAAQGIEDGVASLLVDPSTRTLDIGGKIGCQKFTDLLCEVIQSGKTT